MTIGKINGPLVSVNLTTYNRAHLLPRALDSIFRQSYQNLEIVIVDDCSRDNTASVITGYLQRDSRVRYIRHEVQSGNARARNTALANCKGEYVAFMDDDDEWLDSEKLNKQIQILSKDPKVGIVCSSVRSYSSASDYIDKIISAPNNIRSRILQGNGFIYNSTVLTRRAIMIETGGFDEKMPKGVDSEFFRRCIVKYGYNVYCMPEITTAAHEYGDDRMTPIVNRSSNIKAIKSHARNLSKYAMEYILHPVAAIIRMRSIAKLLKNYIFWRE